MVDKPQSFMTSVYKDAITMIMSNK